MAYIMTRMIEVIYEDDVLRPLKPIYGLKKYEKMWVILCPDPDKKVLHEIVGTLTQTEAEEMRKSINEEFEKIEGEW
jgi:predicted DNA-binding antitoxin AbrB/MazE fold protein